MARCQSCSAPLPANINRCRYCNVRNDVDLHGKHKYRIITKQSKRLCPHCNKALQTVKLKFNEPFYIERCSTCFGLFFDVEEIETLLENSVSNVFNINLKLIKSINQDRYKKKQRIRYVKCPVCQNFMNRVNFAHRSGVIIDQCRNHGIWIDNGEITHLMEWKKAGGELLHAKNKKQPTTKRRAVEYTDAYHLPNDYPKTSNMDIDWLETITSVINKLFR